MDFGRYQLLTRLAAGGMGEVYLARQQGLEGFEKLLVIKTLLPHLSEDEDFARMFLDEARISARLNHPNIAQIYDLGTVEQTYFLAMEFVHGEDLRRVQKSAWTRDKQPLPVPLLCRVIAEAAAGLHYAHQALGPDNKPLGIVHRDVSPQNILLTFEGGVKVIDFGVAKAAGRATTTRTGTLKGKYSYMSPEQVAGRADLDGRSDVFGLGVVLWEALTNQRLFKGDSDVETLAAVGACEVRPPSEVAPRVPKDLDAIVLRALTKNREERYASGAALRLALEDWLVQSRSPATGAHLASYMQDLYTPRLAKERELGLIEALSGGAPALGGGFVGGRNTPSSPSLRLAGASKPQVVARSQVGPAALATVEGAEERTEPEGRRRSRTRLVAALAGAGVLVVAALGFALRPKPAPEATLPAPLPQAQLVVATEPPGAAVHLDGVPLGKTPLNVHVDATGKPATLTFTLDGHALTSRPIELVAGPQRFEVRLEAATPAEVKLRFESEPPGASVTAAGRALGRAPVEASFPRSTTPLAAQFSLDGYRPASQTVVPSADAVVRQPLSKPPRERAKKPDHFLDIKLGR